MDAVNTVTPSQRNISILHVLQTVFGFDSFRPNQEDIIRAVLEKRDVFAVMPTGGGKSICYQLPAILMQGSAVVISPLISLMKDQVDAAKGNGIAAEYINSSLDADQMSDVIRRLKGNKIKLLYIAPERFAMPQFVAMLRDLPLSLFAIDEAHCISEWGHDFRPDYLSLSGIPAKFPGIPVTAFTATATEKVQQDIIRKIGLKDPHCVRASFNRPNLFYQVSPKTEISQQLLEFLKGHEGESGIIYRTTRDSVAGTAEFLSTHGIKALPYHAGLSTDIRDRNQEAFNRDEVFVIVATIAFGMGIDKPNVRWVVHADLPRSVEGYYQETGRAARDGENADALLLYGPGDIASIRWHIGKMEDSGERERAEERLREILRYAESSVCRRTQLLAHFAEQYPGNCTRCDVCAGEVVREDLTESARKVLSAAVRTGERFGAHHLVDILTGNPTDKIMERGHDALPTYGVGREHDRDWWLALVRELDAAGCLVRGEGRTAGYGLSGKGRLLLRGKETFLGTRSSVERSPQERTEPALLDGPAQEDLFQSLRHVRKRLAETRRLPPYVIFSDKTLRAMARNRPTDSTGLLRCPGVGDAKLAAYGTLFLDAIREFLSRAG